MAFLLVRIPKLTRKGGHASANKSTEDTALLGCCGITEGHAGPEIKKRKWPVQYQDLILILFSGNSIMLNI